MAAALKRLIVKRKAVRAQFEKVLDASRAYLDEEEVFEAKLISFEASLRQKTEELKNLDEKVEELIEVDKLEASITESLEFLEPSLEIVASLGVRINQLKLNTSLVENTSVASSSTKVSCRLPKLELPCFSGDPLEWQGFWNQFDVSVNSNESLSDIDKFNYLLRFLKDNALSVVKGLSLSSENYKEALRLLHSRFGNPQFLISAHLDALIKIRKVKSIENVEGLRKLFNEVETCVRNLRALEVETKTYGCLLIPMLKDKLPDEMLMIISRGFGGNIWTLDEFMEFFDKELKAKESFFSPHSKGGETSKNNYGKSITTAELLHVQGESEKKKRKQCVFCEGKHPASHCDKFTDVNVRIALVKRFKLCFLCLNSQHIASKCKSTYLCNKCGGRHHISLCLKNQEKETSYSRQQASPSHVHYVSVTNGVLLQTALSKISSCDGSLRTARILFDSGSQRSYISEEFRKKLGLKASRKDRIILKTFGQSNNSAQNLDVVQLFLRGDSDETFCIEALSVPFICSPLSNQNISFAISEFPSLRSLKLADSNQGSLSQAKVDILVGLDFYHNFFSGKVIHTNGGPTAHETIFGWVLSGPFYSKDLAVSASSSNLCTISHVLRCSYESADLNDDILRTDLERFWQVERVKGSEEECVIHQFEKDIKFNGERYVSRLPFRPDHSPLPDNFNTSRVRLRNLRERLEKNEKLSEYDKIFKDYENNRIIEKVTDEEIVTENAHYLPHRGVIKEERETTKMRVVFDASSNSPSLNDCLYPGPNLISKVFDILLRFRLNPVAILSDIKQAFLQIEIDREHQDFLRFLWYENPFDCSSKIVVYRFLRLVFGLTSSPFILNATVRHHLQKFSRSHTSFTEKFLQDLYVDDCTTGCLSVSEGKEIYNQSTSIMKSGGFVLRKWVSNSKELQTFFNDKEGEDRNEHLKKVLGVEWDLNLDEFVFSFKDIIQLAKSLTPTKRNVLRVAATFFDPLGFISPVTARVKSIFQLLCKDKNEWDSRVSDEMFIIWNTFLNDITRFNEIRVKRFAFVELSEQVESITLHSFCDSSKTCYAAVIYLRIKTSIGIKVNIIAAKTKVAPLKQISIARLELLGCVLSGELLSQVLEALGKRISLNRIKCWSDSQVALCWLKGKNKCWKPWVENRVVKVRKIVKPEDWYFISGKDNPADIPTRVCDISDFDRWVKGPNFLYEDEIENDCFDVEARLIDADVLVESRKNTNTVSTTLVNNEVQPNIMKLIDCRRFGTLNKLLNTTAYVLHFVDNLKKRVTKIEIDSNYCPSAEDRERALTYWIKAEQIDLQSRLRYQKLEQSLKLFSDDSGIVRLKGRFGSTSFEYDVKHPILLSSGDRHFTTLLVRDCHQRVLHAGVETTLNFLRRRFWIIKGRQTIKSILRSCVICKRYQGRMLNPQQSPDLPSFRIDDSFSFCNIGLDYAGPLYVREFAKAAAKKVYILLFTCATSRAIHLELVHDMKAPSFIRAFDRFVARKGVPRFVISDNFKTFKSKQVKCFLSQQGIIQKFILPASPWWGGFYERLVRSVKLSLKKCLGRSLLTYEQLETVLCKSEFVINNRPLTYVSTDDLEEAITPFHLLFGRNVSYPNKVVYSDPSIISSNTVINRRAKYMKSLIQNQWKSFENAYVNELRQHHLYVKSNKIPSQPPKLGDVVLIRDDNPLPRQRWRLGRITELISGKDNLIRGVKLTVASQDPDKSSSQTCHRPLQKIIPLEVSDNYNISTPSRPFNNSDTTFDENTSDSNLRSKRRAAREGQIIRRLKQKYVD